ncbi:hypothetical protein T439DRAFT_384307 [Meredithblackwellia eburnea MCA 4105]
MPTSTIFRATIHLDQLGQTTLAQLEAEPFKIPLAGHIDSPTPFDSGAWSILIEAAKQPDPQPAPVPNQEPADQGPKYCTWVYLSWQGVEQAVLDSVVEMSWTYVTTLTGKDHRPSTEKGIAQQKVVKGNWKDLGTSNSILLLEFGPSRALALNAIGVKFEWQVEGWKAVKEIHILSGEDLARKHFQMVTQPHPFDVRFTFPRAAGASLWANSALLKHASPYYRMILSSGMKEGGLTEEGNRLAKRLRMEPKPVVPHDGPSPTEDDSDDDDDEDQRPYKTVDPLMGFRYHSIPVTATAFRTYSAMLGFVTSGHIRFAKLRSTIACPPTEPKMERKETFFSLSSWNSQSPMRESLHSDYLDADHETQMDSAPYPLPPLASPKSVFKLADFLGLDDLKTKSLDNFKSQLTVKNVLAELFCETSGRYVEVSRVVLDFVAMNKDDVADRIDWEQLMEDVELMDEPWAGKLAVGLSQAFCR